MSTTNEGSETMNDAILDEKVKFICAHEAEINPLLSDAERSALLGMGCRHIASDGDVNTLLERFEVKVYQHNKKIGTYSFGAKRVIMSMSETFDFVLQKSLLEGLLSDSRCNGVAVVTDNVSSVLFATWRHEHPDVEFTRERKKDRDNTHDEQDDLVLPDIARVAKGAEIAIIGFNLHGSPNETMLMNAKSLFGVRKLFLVNGGWGSLAGNQGPSEWFNKADKFDVIFCNDLLSQRIMQAGLPLDMRERVLVTGTAALDGLELTLGSRYERETRQKLDIHDRELAVLYCGDYSTGAQERGLHPRYNEETFAKTLEVLKTVALTTPEKDFVFLVRPHPGDGNKVELLKPHANLPKNLRVVSAEKGRLTMQEAAYAADMVLSIASTENILATMRGKVAVYLAYKEPGLGLDILMSIYGNDLLPLIKNHPGIYIAQSQAELAVYISQLVRHHAPSVLKKPAGSTKAMLDVIFAE